MPRTLHLDAADPTHLARAAEILRRGGLVAFPTETVYGLGADALNPEAVARIFTAKQRPHWDPLIVHIATRTQLSRITLPTPAAEPLIEAFWPGPLTLLLPRTPLIPNSVTAARPLAGVRIPAHPIAQQLLRLTQLPIAAPSANRFGHTSPTTAAHVLADLDGRIDAVLDAGPTQIGLESTVAAFTPGGLTIYRPGAVTVAMLESILGPGTVHLHTPIQTETPESLPSPGVGLRHYAPRARLILTDASIGPDFELTLATLDREHEILGVMLPDGWPAPPDAITFPWGSWQDKHQLAQRLFQGLRTLDDQGATLILCPTPNSEGLGEALRDRLEKAARRA